MQSLGEALPILKSLGIDEEGIGLWGSGVARREFLHSEDVADACLFVMKNVDLSHQEKMRNTHINLGYGEDLSIKELALLVFKILGFEGDLRFDKTKLDGTLRKLPCCEKLKALGFKPKISLEEGIKRTYEWYLSNDTKRK